MRSSSMTFPCFPQLLVAMLAACALASCAPSTRASPEDAKAGVETALMAYAAAINAGDIPAASAFYDQDTDFHWIDQGQVQYRSASDAGKSLAAIAYQGSKPVLTLEQPLVTDLGADAALTSVRYTFDMQAPDGTSLFGWQGWMTIAWVKREDGWKIAAGQAGPAADESEASGAQGPSR